jgi:hypothetical protein
MSSQPDLATLYPDAIVDAAIVAWINHDLQYQHHLRPDMRRALYAADLARASPMDEPNTTTEARIPGIVSGRFALFSENVLAMLGAVLGAMLTLRARAVLRKSNVGIVT